MDEYQHKSIDEEVPVSMWVNAMLDDIEYVYKPLLNFIDNKVFPPSRDHFTMYRVLFPIIEVASKIEFAGDVPKLLSLLSVPRPEIIWQMFRHGLFHHVRPFFAKIDGTRIDWAVPQFECEHYDSGNAIGIYAPKLLNDLEEYLKKFKDDARPFLIQTGLELYLKQDKS